jgi:hypothetical protein
MTNYNTKVWIQRPIIGVDVYDEDGCLMEWCFAVLMMMMLMMMMVMMMMMARRADASFPFVLSVS